MISNVIATNHPFSGNILSSVAFDPADHFTRDVDTGGFSIPSSPGDAFTSITNGPRLAAEYPHQQRPAPSFARLLSRFTLLWCDTGDACRAATMQIGRKSPSFARRSIAATTSSPTTDSGYRTLAPL